MNWQLFITAAATLLITIGMSIVGYFVSQLNKRIDAHDLKDDHRFDQLAIKVDAVKGNELLYEKLDVIKADVVEKRHSFRAEMREAFANVYEREEKMEERLRAEIARIEKR
jgi:uncharacterized membrane protein